MFEKTNKKDLGKNIILILILLMVLLNGLPFIENPFLPLLETLGIDLYFQPITSDMLALYDQDKNPLYKQNITIIIEKEEGLEIVDLENQEFYKFKAPLLSFVETIIENGDVELSKQFLCKGLNLEKNEKFMIKSDFKKENKILNKYFICK